MTESTHSARRGGLRRKGLAAFPATVVAVVLFASPAFAHFCSNAQRSDTANAAVSKNSNGWFTIRAFLPELGLCAAGEAELIVLLDAEGVDVDLPILAHSVLANGALKNGKQVKPFEYLPEDVDFDALIGQAAEACAP